MMFAGLDHFADLGVVNGNFVLGHWNGFPPQKCALGFLATWKLYHHPPSIIIMYSFQINELFYAVFPSSNVTGITARLIPPAGPPAGNGFKNFRFRC
jgi:hypothetical protein